ncbi:solute carrier family member 5 [Stylonychia lemnae]|uniref:Solute carrier family member 5 n=1 Tax=Stylonychia lemnae TaxID=5949 RepID=A0A078AZJ4_STYLE|nr:solute carrier family member 5 [Stylonychia lemnae]|eukprot:CDW87584.1 solute carrier family member 5 [Stylonychia lemnae]
MALSPLQLNLKHYTLDEVFNLSGGFDYLVWQPVYMCPNEDGSKAQCDSEQACKNKNSYVDWSNQYSLDNWVNDFNLKCTPQSTLSQVTFFFYLGYTFGCFFIPRFLDLYGRKWPFMLCLIAQLPIYVGIILSKSLYLNMALSFMIGICTVGRYNGGYINISEYVHTKYKNAVSTLLLVAEQLSVIFIVLYFKFISKNWQGLQIIGVSINFISIIGCYFLPESPEQAYSFYDFRKTKQAFRYIAKFNRSKMDSYYLFDIEGEMKSLRQSISNKKKLTIDQNIKEKFYSKSIEMQQNLRSSVRAFIKDRTLVRNLIISIFLWMCTFLGYNIAYGHDNYFPSDQFDNDMANATSEIVAFLLAGYIYYKIGARKFFFIFYLVALLGGILVFVLDQSKYKELDMISTFVTRFGVAATYQGVYLANDLFPTIFASTSFGVCNIFAGLAGALSTQIKLLEDGPMMITYLFIILFAVIVSLILVDSKPTSVLVQQQKIQFKQDQEGKSVMPQEFQEDYTMVEEEDDENVDDEDIDIDIQINASKGKYKKSNSRAESLDRT